MKVEGRLAGSHKSGTDYCLNGRKMITLSTVFRNEEVEEIENNHALMVVAEGMEIIP